MEPSAVLIVVGGVGILDLWKFASIINTLAPSYSSDTGSTTPLNVASTYRLDFNRYSTLLSSLFNPIRSASLDTIGLKTEYI